MDRGFIEFSQSKRSMKYVCKEPEVFMHTHDAPNLPPVERLNEELRELYNTLRPKDEEVQIREYLLKRMVRLLRTGLDGPLVSAFGSYECELFLPTSDFDIVVTMHEPVPDKNAVLERIRDVVCKSDFIMPESVIHLSRARIPILRCNDAIFNHRFDISVGEFGLEQANYIKRTLCERPYLKVFALLLKHFLKTRDLNESKRGGLCSYAQFLMLLHFFQLHPMVQAGCIDPIDNVGVLFLDFFQYYGFNLHANSKITFAKVGYKRKDEGDLVFSIEDPVDPAHNVGALCTNGNALSDAFNHAFRIMSLVLRSNPSKRKSPASLWMKINKVEEEWRQRNVGAWREMNPAHRATDKDAAS